MLHYGNATQLAELNPMVRAKQDADETTAFKAFFFPIRRLFSNPTETPNESHAQTLLAGEH